MVRNVLAAIAACVVCGCGAENGGTSIVSEPTESLCIEAGRREADESVAILPVDGVNECTEDIDSYDFSLDPSNNSATFRLYGIPQVAYCIAVMRVTGYITISHRSGTVTRDGDIFSWCITPQSEEVETMTVRSLTVRARFLLSVP